jgi:hypothetical protein
MRKRNQRLLEGKPVTFFGDFNKGTFEMIFIGLCHYRKKEASKRLNPPGQGKSEMISMDGRAAA